MTESIFQKPDCSICNGLGYELVVLDGDTVIEDCVCMVELKRQIGLFKSNIPKRYWNFDIENIDTWRVEENQENYDVVNEYINNLRDNITKGRGFWIISAPGLGKSTILCSILKKSHNLGYRPYYIKASKIIKMKFEALRDPAAARLINYIVEDADIVAIDEMEKVYLASEDSLARNMFFEFISDVYDARKSVLISSNKSRKDSLKGYRTDVQDRLLMLPIIKLRGESARKDW